MTKPKLNPDNVLIVGDLHEPFTLDGYRQHCKQVQKEYKCGTVVFLGDIVDNHSISYHEVDPDLWSPADEMKRADIKLAQWFKDFPKAYITWGNHDALPDRKGKTVGLPKRCFKTFREMWKLPVGWIDGPEFVIHDVLFKHKGKGGINGHLNTAISSRMSTVVGHAHSVAGVAWNASSRDRIFGMNPGCGINRKSLAFAYGKDMENKPFVGCGVVLNKGKLPLILPMELGSK